MRSRFSKILDSDNSHHPPKERLGSVMWRFRRELFWVIKRYPNLFLPASRLAKWLGQSRGETVSKRTQLVIEGYPRSANTFAVRAFTLAQANPVCLAHHWHAPAQVIWAAKNNIPTLVVIRNPRDAVLSTILRQPKFLVGPALREYRRFYAAIEPYLDRIVIGTFDDVTNNFGQIIDKVNHRFGTSFSLFEHTKESEQEVFELVETAALADVDQSSPEEMRVARPSRDRDEAKQALAEQLETPEAEALLLKCEDLYRRFTSECD